MADQPLDPVHPEDRLRRLVSAGIRISAKRSLDEVLQAVVDSAREVIGAEYAALGVLDLTGTQLDRFVVSGLSSETQAQIGDHPAGTGVLGMLITDPRPLRLSNVPSHQKAAGFPKSHPPMQSFLGVPIIGRERPLGNLYLTEKIGSTEFTEEDEAVAVMLAAQAAVAVENATLYEEGQRLVHEVRAMQTSRDRFFATINHELRNALTAVYGWADLLIRKVGPDGPRAAREVYESAERTLGLLNDLLDLSRLEAERLRPTIRDANAQQLVAEALASVEPVAKERAVELHAVGLDHSAPCQTDAQRVRQILINVLTNAIRHSPDGDTVTVRTDVTDQQLRFTVIDHGPGIPAEEQSHIFEAFHRAGTSDERGTGLGLTLSRQLALLLGGDLTVESHLGEGAAFILSIPRWFGKS
jgi:signal transduction histidine kinase